jgi:hypothetical protein
MKHEIRSVVVVCALLLGIVISGLSRVNSVVTTVSVHHSSASTMSADGGTPVPPFPPCGPQSV